LFKSNKIDIFFIIFYIAACDGRDYKITEKIEKYLIKIYKHTLIKVVYQNGPKFAKL